MILCTLTAVSPKATPATLLLVKIARAVFIGDDDQKNNERFQKTRWAKIVNEDRKVWKARRRRGRRTG